MSAATVPFIRSLQSSLQMQEDAYKPLRATAFAEFLRIGLPTQKLDAWKYTDLRRLAAREFHLADRAPSVDATALLSIECAQRIVFVDGAFDAKLSLLPTTAGVTARIFKTSPTSESQIANLQARAQQSAFELLNTALSTGGAAIEVESHALLAQPIYVAFIWSKQAAGLMCHPHVTLQVVNGARAQLIEHHLNLGTAANFSNVITSITVGKNAELLHTRIQEDAAASFSIESVLVDVENSARYLNHQYVLGAGLSRCDMQLQLKGSEAHAELHGLLLAQGNQHVDVRTCIEHRVPHTRSIEDYRGIADGRGRVVFNGKVIVHPDAQKTDARQSSRNLLLAPTAEIDTRPELEIYANDVQCAHGATVGQLDASALFYLQSRGLNAADARALLTHAFAAELLERLPDATLREYLLGRLMQHLGSRLPNL